jgi:signal peptidase
VQDLVISDDGFAELATELLGRGHSIRFRAHGRSMRPLIRDGDILTAEPLGARRPRLGEVILHGTAEGRAVAHRVIARRTVHGQTVFLTCGDGSGRSAARVEEKQVLGRVVTAQRGDRVIRLDRGMASAVGLLWVAVSHARYFTFRVAGFLRRKLSRRTGAGPSGPADPSGDAHLP